MKILNFGSVNIDFTYRVPHFVRPGETLAATSVTRNAGGKGFNQSVARGVMFIMRGISVRTAFSWWISAGTMGFTLTF